jgi:L-fuculose-phosphate aldolase
MADTLSLGKDELVRRAKQRMEQELVGETWSVGESIALTCRILYSRGHDSGLAGQITARGDAPGTYITQRLGLGFDEVSVSNLLVVDEDLNVVDGQGMANPANRFHSWIYRARPDVGCVIHTHPLYTSALSMLEIPLKVSHMDACMLYDDVAFLPKWPGVPVGNDEGEIITAALGDKRAVLLAHHGLVVACPTIQEACVIAVQFERAAKLQLIASAAGQIRDIDPALGQEAHDWILHGRRSTAAFAYFARQVLRTDQSCLA